MHSSWYIKILQEYAAFIFPDLSKVNTEGVNSLSNSLSVAGADYIFCMSIIKMKMSHPLKGKNSVKFPILPNPKLSF